MISVCIIAKNEENTIEQLFSDVKNQDYSHEDIEIVLVDSMSSDNTKMLMLQFSNSENDFSDIRVYENRKENQASGWNVAIQNARGDIIIRVDAHAMLPKDFVKKSVACIMSGENVCGGPRPNIAVPSTKWTDVLLGTESSMFGSSIATYRRAENEKKYVKSVFHGAYRKEVFEKVGGFNEKLGRTEDNEMHYRIRKSGYQICYDPQIYSYQHIRSTWRGMIRQKYSNGYWIGLTLGVCPGCLAVYHFIPAAFVCALLFCVFVGIGSTWVPMICLGVAYGGFCAVSTGMLLWKNKKNFYFLITPLIFLSLHMMYGIGTMIGMIRMPFWRKKVYKKEK